MAVPEGYRGDHYVLLGGYVCNRQISRNMDILERYPWLENMEKLSPAETLHDRNPDFNEFRLKISWESNPVHRPSGIEADG